MNAVSGTERMPAEQRREMVLAAAGRIFGEHGYAATTTDQVAVAAGISQAYAVRMFGTKEKLFLQVMHRALDKLTGAFRAALAQSTGTVDGVDDRIDRLARAYAELIDDRTVVLALMQAFVAGGDPVIGGAARRGFLQIYGLLREEAGLEVDRAYDFLANGMLLNTLIAVRMPLAYRDDDAARELLERAFPRTLEAVLEAAAPTAT